MHLAKRLVAATAVCAILAAPMMAPAAALAAPKAKPAATADQALPSIDIPYTKFVLPNGLTVIVHEDHKAPIVAVNIWYHVGAKNEPPGKTGFAHLFEHLMFNGSENFNTDWFKALEKLGATDMNGTTNEDRTNYFENVPTAALDQVLWLESDRMGWLTGAIDQAKLDEQRGVVQNEKRQGQNQPYSIAWDIITESTYDRDHPYGHTVIGSMKDLDNASVEDVKEWFKTYYGPSNATLVLAGDITVEEAKAKAMKYFGDIPSGPPVARQKVWVAKRTGSQRAEVQDRVAQARWYRVWNAPEAGSEDADLLSLLSDVLASDKTARLYKRLVYDEQIATNVTAFLSEGEIGSTFHIQVTAKPGVGLDQIEKIVEEEMAKLLAEGPTQQELDKIKVDRLAGFVRGAERIGGFGGKSDILAESQVFRGSPDAYQVTLARWKAATPAQVKAAGVRWLSDGDFTLDLTPFAPKETTLPEGKRAPAPPVGQIAAPAFDKYETATLSNGMKVMLVRRTAVPVVQLNMIFPGGSAGMAPEDHTIASLAMSMMDEGAGDRDALTISRQQSELGANLRTSGGTLFSTVSLSALKAKLGPSLDLMADVVLRPTFPQAELDRQKKLAIAGLQRSKQQPQSIAFRVFGQKVYGPDHPYGAMDTEESISSVTRDDLIAFHKAQLNPNGAMLVAVGDITMPELVAAMEPRFGGWTSPTQATRATVPPPSPAPKAIYLVDKPGAQQSTILAAMPAPARDEKDERAVELMNNVFGGAFVSRLNMNLREDKHWSYGASSFMVGSLGPRAFVAYAGVQTDKTRESMVEFKKELDNAVGATPITAEELAKAQTDMIQSLPGQWETGGAVAGSLSTLYTLERPADFWDGYASGLRAVDVASVNAAAKKIIKPGDVIWVVVGDRARIEKDLKALGFGPVIVVDADGNPVK
ncbi:MAG: insulinase family protein [Caulobacter sp.]|nr:insulinase family protein [Caulobacter sp.]